MSDDHHTLLDVLAMQLTTDQVLYNNLRFLPGTHQRAELLFGHLRSNARVHAILSAHLRSESNPRVELTFPITLPPSWDEAVIVAPSQTEINLATQQVFDLDNTMCTICQETMSNGLRLRYCRHCFHSTCIQEWFTRSALCPVCRHDVRGASPTTQ